MTTATGTATQTTEAGTRPLVTGINHVAIVTSDAERLIAFYVDVFDGERVEVPQPPGTRGAVVLLSHHTGLTIMEAPGNPHGRGSARMLERGHLDHVAFDAPSARALEEVRRRLVARGACDGEVRDYGALVSVYFVDPDGMGAEVCWVRDPTFSDVHPPEPFTGSLLDLT